MSRLLILIISVLFISFDQPKLVKTKVAEGITASIPQDWRPMDQLDFTERYPSVRAPLGAFTNQERSIDFSVNISATRWTEKDLELAQRFFKAGIANLFDRVEMINEGIVERKGKKFIFFEFESRVNGSREKEGQREPILKYSYIQYYIKEGQTLVFSFNCPRRDRQEWEGTAKLMMESVKVK
ncbi:MAG TPA: hypothetical protein VGD40_14430 [Chryseosolibacter sp.]